MTTQKLIWLRQFRFSDDYNSISVFVSSLVAYKASKFNNEEEGFL